jgi:dolichol-phosphate mannosyltransferase
MKVNPQGLAVGSFLRISNAIRPQGEQGGLWLTRTNTVHQPAPSIQSQVPCGIPVTGLQYMLFVCEIEGVLGVQLAVQVTVVVPTYNERENIEPLVAQLLALPTAVRVIVVDDNSPDGTGEIAERLATESDGRVGVIHRAGKLGLGTAYIAGFGQALAEGSDLICTMDADFSHNPRYVPAMVDKIGQGYDLVIGSRYVRGGGARGCTFDRKLLSWGANAFARTMLGLCAHDTTAGFRCYRREVLKGMDLNEIKASGYSFLIEMLYRVQRCGWQVGEVPIVFENRRLGRSKISQDEIIRALGTVLRLGWTRLKGKRA